MYVSVSNCKKLEDVMSLYFMQIGLRNKLFILYGLMYCCYLGLTFNFLLFTYIYSHSLF